MAFIERTREKSTAVSQKLYAGMQKEKFAKSIQYRSIRFGTHPVSWCRLLITLKPKANGIIAWTLCISTLHTSIRPKHYLVLKYTIWSTRQMSWWCLKPHVAAKISISRSSNKHAKDRTPPTLLSPHPNPIEVKFHVWWIKALPSPAWNLMWRKRFRCHL